MMKIATYNLRVDTDYDEDWQWKYRADKVLALINDHDWDLFGVQEIRPVQVADLMTLKNYTSLTVERDGDGQGEGIGLYFKPTLFSLVESGYFWLSLTPDEPSIHPQAEYSRLCLWAILENQQGQVFLLINTHLDNSSEIARYEGMNVIINRLAEKIATYPTILMGDLNAEPNERIHPYLEKLFMNAKKHAQEGHYGPQGSYQNFDYTMPWDQVEEIDYLYTNGIVTKKTSCLTDSYDGRYPSDHFPLEAELLIEE